MLNQTPPASTTLLALNPLPLPDEIQLGRIRVTSATSEFMQAIDAGVESCHQGDLVERTEMSAEALFNRLVATISDGPGVSVPILDQWRLGFIIGQVIGLLNPDLADGDRALSYLELLSRKCQQLPDSKLKQAGDTHHA